MPITIKLNVDGTSRRLKLPLRDLTRDTLEPKLRHFLGIPLMATALFERYSDSAGAYIFLDPNNISVYKQLGRAAKAKQKLKLRVTTREPAHEEPKSGPKPASVEDAAEEDASAETIEVAQLPAQAEQTPSSPPTRTTPTETEIEDRQSKSLAALESTLEAIQSSIVAASAAAASASSVAPSNMENATASPKRALPSSPVASIKSVRTARAAFSVCCNSCDGTVPEVHYHCSTCDDGDFDLCQDCVDAGITCYGDDHWLIKRYVRDGQITNNTTERIAPKVKAAAPKLASPAPAPLKVVEPALAAPTVPAASLVSAAKLVIPVYEDRYSSIRTCNSCVQELSEANFVHCITCEDFDLCRPCFAKNRHGHHPGHGFVPAVQGTRLENEVSHRLDPGRGQAHNAICDGCDEEIKGIRHKCLDCPDWDYCNKCIQNAPFIHQHHRFVPVYEELEPASSARIRALDRATHYNICCDGPLCFASRTSYIVGDRYKCAVCDDTDFCANCEASPANNHNKTHPLIKFRTSVRHVNITTSVEHENGRSTSVMGDRPRSPPSTPKAPAVAPDTPRETLRTSIQTVVDFKPSAPLPENKIDTPQVNSAEKVDDPLGVKSRTIGITKATPAPELIATFVRDTVPDYTVLDSDTIFEQTWVLRNDGTVAWPAGCSVKYVGGDYMGHLDANRPAATQDLESSSESSMSHVPVAPGEEHSFTVLLRTPQRTGRVVSNWRLTTKDGLKFGHRLWCDVLVRNTKPPASIELEQARPQFEIPHEAETNKAETKVETLIPEDLAGEPAIQRSQMIFPKLEKESPETSIHEDAVAEAPLKTEEEYEDLASEDSWVEDEDSFLTDEEYDILDASDEESQHAA